MVSSSYSWLTKCIAHVSFQLNYLDFCWALHRHFVIHKTSDLSIHKLNRLGQYFTLELVAVYSLVYLMCQTLCNAFCCHDPVSLFSVSKPVINFIPMACFLQILVLPRLIFLIVQIALKVLIRYLLYSVNASIIVVLIM